MSKKVLCINEVDGSTSIDVIDLSISSSRGCYYPKGSVIQFVSEDALIDFIELLPDDVWDYWQDSVTQLQFVKPYFLEVF